MRVDLALDLFPSPASPMHLEAIGLGSFEGRHRVVVEDDQDPAFIQWFSGLQPGHQLQWNQAFTQSYTLESIEPAVRRIRVSATAQSDWGATPPNLTLSDAAKLARQPLVAYLEDWQSDRGFILAVATADEKRHLEEMESINALRFHNGGGITNLTKQLNQQGAGGPPAIFQMWTLFDSDALHPGVPSEQTKKAQQACTLHGIPHHRLARRTIESYLPRDALRGWAYSVSKPSLARKSVFKAHLLLSDDQRFHYNMKGGFVGDQERDDLVNVGTLFDGLNEKALSDLSNGFGNDIAKLFSEERVSESALRADGAWAELRQMITSLVGLVR